MNKRRYWLPSALFAALVVTLSVTLLAIGARSPYTHSNLSPGPVQGYDRTTQTLVGPAVPLARSSVDLNAQADLVTQGAALFIGLDCASCHGLQGQGGVFAPVIVGTDATTLASKTGHGPGGMPAFAGLDQHDLDAIAAYLQSVAKPASQDN